ncbi:MAG: hypothetical protein ACYDB7_05485 [Mycobacteriales bacterium]
MPIDPGPYEQSPFAVLQRAFTLLTCDPHPLAVHGTEIGHGLPNRLIGLGELRSRLLHPSCRYPTRDAAITLLLRRAQSEGGAWTVGLAGVLLPGLRRAAGPLVRACPGKAADIEAEMLTGLIAAIATTRLGQARPASSLTWRARRAAEHLVRAELGERARPGVAPVSAEPPRPFGHPDLVLADAVAAGVISAEDAELIGATRLGELSLAEAATVWGCSYTAVGLRRWRAESALTPWLTERIRDGFEVKPAQNPGSKGGGRPRQGHRSGRRPGDATTPPDQPQPRR